jgi:hypothetical protein
MGNMIEEMKISTPWKVIDCHVKDCWCGVIVPENYDDENSEDDYIVGAGQLTKEMAHYIVKLHNAKFAVKSL